MLMRTLVEQHASSIVPSVQHGPLRTTWDLPRICSCAPIARRVEAREGRHGCRGTGWVRSRAIPVVHSRGQGFRLRGIRVLNWHREMASGRCLGASPHLTGCTALHVPRGLSMAWTYMCLRGWLSVLCTSRALAVLSCCGCSALVALPGLTAHNVQLRLSMPACCS
jgi:hypothetical protein